MSFVAIAQCIQAFSAVDDNVSTASNKPQAASATRHSVRGHPVSDVIEGTLWNRELGTMSEEVVTALVHQLFEGIRDYLVQATEMKFNCFFLMPIIDTFPTKLREELEAAYENNLEEVFDVATVRTILCTLGHAYLTHRWPRVLCRAPAVVMHSCCALLHHLLVNSSQAERAERHQLKHSRKQFR